MQPIIDGQETAGPTTVVVAKDVAVENDVTDVVVVGRVS